MHAASPEEWIAHWRGLRSRAQSLTEDEWARVKNAVDDTYSSAGLNRPAIVQARSPMEVMRIVHLHQKTQVWPQINAASKIAGVIGTNEQTLLRHAAYVGDMAFRVDSGGLGPRVWGTDLHPHMTRMPCVGNLQCGTAAEVAWFLDRRDHRLRTHIGQGLQGLVGRSLAGPARLLDDIAVVSDLPIRFSTDEDGRPHHESGSAIEWADGFGLNFWHGTRVPHDFFEWGAKRALAEVDIEARRCAFERLGVDVLEQSLRLLAEAPDPANPPHVLRLYDVPRPWLNGRILVVENASLDKGGRRRRFQLFVPPHITDPVEAAANSFGLTAEQYRQLQRAT